MGKHAGLMTRSAARPALAVGRFFGRERVGQAPVVGDSPTVRRWRARWGRCGGRGAGLWDEFAELRGVEHEWGGDDSALKNGVPLSRQQSPAGGYRGDRSAARTRSPRGSLLNAHPTCQLGPRPSPASRERGSGRPRQTNARRGAPPRDSTTPTPRGSTMDPLLHTATRGPIDWLLDSD